MIQRALKVVGLYVNYQHVKIHDSPASSEKLLDNDPNGKPRLQPWHYRSAMGCLSYIYAMIHPDITMPVQQCARFCNNPRQEHEESIKRIFRYLLCVHEKGLILKPDRTLTGPGPGSIAHLMTPSPPITVRDSSLCMPGVLFYGEDPCKNWLHCKQPKQNILHYPQHSAK